MSGHVTVELDTHARWLRRATLFLAIAATIVALFAVDHRARKGRNALLRWTWALEAVEAGHPLYGEESQPFRSTLEGYPTLPVTLVLLRPFHALGPRLGPLAWAAFSLALAWAVVLVALRLAVLGSRSDAVETEPRGPTGGIRDGRVAAIVPPLVLLIAGRVLYSEVQHGNLNLVVAATFVAGVAAWASGRAFAAGVCFGAGAVIKVTPLLALLWLLRARSVAGLAGFFAGVVALAFVVPGLVFGWERNLDFVAGWWRQMAGPYLAGRELTTMQTGHINQSLLGVLARYVTDAVAIEARPPVHRQDVVLGFVDLAPRTLHNLHRALAVLLVVHLWRRAPRSERSASPRAVLGVAALFALAMLALSERSWKHHFVLLPLPLAYLAWSAIKPLRGTDAAPAQRYARVGLGLAFAAFVMTGEGILGARGADLAEAYGAYFWGGAALFFACDRVLVAERRLDAVT
jgi:alpha-1,2-mannosyltransferase